MVESGGDKAWGAVLLLVAALTGWFWRLVMGHGKRITEIEKSMAILNTHLSNIDTNTDKVVKSIERMETRHREDVVRAYEKIETLHIILVKHFSASVTITGRDDD